MREKTMCLDQEILSAYLDGEVMSHWKAKIEGHLAWCETCRMNLARLERTRRLLMAETPGDMQGPMERVRRRLLAESIRQPVLPPIWRRIVAVPMPVIAGAAALVLLLAASLTFSLLRSNVGLVRITKAPSGGTEIQITAPIASLESLLRSVDNQDSPQDVITLPSRYPLMSVGQPLMGKEAEFVRKTHE
jgi:hypothetical protein